MPKTAFITGVAGQDGSYLAELLLKKDYRVTGLDRYGSSPIVPKLVELITGDITDAARIESFIEEYKPDEVYNLAAVHAIADSWERPLATMEANGTAPIQIAEALRRHVPHGRFFQASSMEIFGDTDESPQNEKTRTSPRNPYGVAKLASHRMVSLLRERFGVFAVSGILYNHESPRRGHAFVTRKITRTAAAIKLGQASELVLGDLSARRDWGYARDYVEAMWMMLQAETPSDYVIATGETHSVQDFVDAAFGHLALDPKQYVRVDASFVRPPDAVELQGDASAIRRDLGWQPHVPFEELVRMMVEHDLAELQ